MSPSYNILCLQNLPEKTGKKKWVKIQRILKLLEAGYLYVNNLSAFHHFITCECILVKATRNIFRTSQWQFLMCWLNSQVQGIKMFSVRNCAGQIFVGCCGLWWWQLVRVLVMAAWCGHHCLTSNTSLTYVLYIFGKFCTESKSEPFWWAWIWILALSKYVQTLLLHSHHSGIFMCPAAAAEVMSRLTMKM